MNAEKWFEWKIWISYRLCNYDRSISGDESAQLTVKTKDDLIRDVPMPAIRFDKLHGGITWNEYRKNVVEPKLETLKNIKEDMHEKMLVDLVKRDKYLMNFIKARVTYSDLKKISVRKSFYGSPIRNWEFKIKKGELDFWNIRANEAWENYDLDSLDIDKKVAEHSEVERVEIGGLEHIYSKAHEHWVRENKILWGIEEKIEDEDENARLEREEKERKEKEKKERELEYNFGRHIFNFGVLYWDSSDYGWFWIHRLRSEFTIKKMAMDGVGEGYRMFKLCIHHIGLMYIWRVSNQWRSGRGQGIMKLEKVGTVNERFNNVGVKLRVRINRWVRCNLNLKKKVRKILIFISKKRFWLL